MLFLLKKILSDKKINHTKFEPIKSINTILYGEMLITMLIFEPKETSKINDFRGLLNFGGPYEPVYEPFYAGFEENFNMSIDLIVLKNYFDLGIRT